MRNVNYLRLLSDQAHPLFVFCRCVLGKPLFEMCWFYMGIAQIALDPPPSVKQANVEKKVSQTILASPYTPSPRQRGKRVPQTILASLYTNPPLRAMPIWKQHISKRGFPYYEKTFYFFGAF